MHRHICFHGIGTCRTEREPGEARYWVTRDDFLRILDAVADSDTGISFDDGNRSDIDVALPALQERGLRATFFHLAGRLDDPDSLAAPDLRALVAAGMEVGSHGWEHVPWRGLSPAEAEREFVDARTALQEASGTVVTSAALPLGRYDRQVLKRLRRAGYSSVFTSDRHPVHDGAWLRARYSVTAGDTAGSISQLLSSRPGLHDVRQVAAGLVKRMR